MDSTPRGSEPKHSRVRPEFERIALLLQGGGALGSYQAGVYQALAEADLHPHWVAGISIGAINSALIAGNAKDQRVLRLREFWETVTQGPFGLPYLAPMEIKNDFVHQFINQGRARGELPRDMIEVDTRLKDIRYSSRTRMGTDQFRKMQALRRATAKLLSELPDGLRESREAKMLAAEADNKVYNIIHLIYRAQVY